MKKLFLALLLSVLLIGGTTGCSGETGIKAVKTLDEMKTYLDITDTEEKYYDMIGAEDGFGFEYKGSTFEAYEFKDKSQMNDTIDAYKKLAEQFDTTLKYETINNILIICDETYCLTDLVK